VPEITRRLCFDVVFAVSVTIRSMPTAESRLFQLEGFKSLTWLEPAFV